MKHHYTPQLYFVRDIVKVYFPAVINPNIIYETVNAIVLDVSWQDNGFLYYLGIDLRSAPAIGFTHVTVSFENIHSRITDRLN